MAEEIDDNEFFQQDFTTASEWEIFNARLEEIFHEWKLPYTYAHKAIENNELFQTEWNITTEIIMFANVELTVTRYQAKLLNEDNDEECLSPTNKPKVCQVHQDLMSLTNNFNICNKNHTGIHPLAIWYGLRDFVVIQSVDYPITNESQYRVLLSSACITAAESNTEIPIFVNVMAHGLNVFLGVCESPSIRINFDVVALETTPPTCRYLTGLLSLFKGKVGYNYLKPTTVSVQLTYCLTEFINTVYSNKRKIPFSNEQEEGDEANTNDNKQFIALPYGVSFDPVSDITINCRWREIAENVLIDSANYSDLNPMFAPNWAIQASFKQDPIFYLTDCLSEYLKLCESKKTLTSVLGSSYDFGANQTLDGDNPLDLLTESKIPTLSSVIPVSIKTKGTDSKKSKSKQFDGPLKEEELMEMLYYMFPDAQNNPVYPYEYNSNDDFDPLRIKSATIDSLVFRLSTLLATCYSFFGGISAIAYLWAEFTQEMRYRMERCIEIPGVTSGFPDSRTSLLHQKLQMLNVCMERRRLREGGLPFSMLSKNSKRDGQDESEDEFYDCDNDEDQDTVYEPWNKPEGRLSKLDNLKLIESSIPLFIPITQEPVPKTEDQLEDDAEVMLKLGPGSELCAQMMSASLLSDMESFKAANPRGKLEDFIRWYSPRDWIEEPDENGITTGHLSQRMLIPENTWQTVWNTARPVPAKRQKRLFDDTKEAEKVLHYFETRTIGQICQLTLAPLFHAAILKIKEETISTYSLENLNDKIIMNLCKLSRENWSNESSSHAISSHKKWETLLQEIGHIENTALKSASLFIKLFGASQLLTEKENDIMLKLINGFEYELEGAAKNDISIRILNMFTDAKLSKSELSSDPSRNNQMSLPEPNRKEYILRVDGKTSHKGIGGPQYLRAVLDKHFRLCGAFSENTTFL